MSIVISWIRIETRRSHDTSEVAHVALIVQFAAFHTNLFIQIFFEFTIANLWVFIFHIIIHAIGFGALVMPLTTIA